MYGLTSGAVLRVTQQDPFYTLSTNVEDVDKYVCKVLVVIVIRITKVQKNADWGQLLLNQDQELRSRPELLGRGDLQDPSHLTLLVDVAGQILRALARHNLVLLVGTWE